MNTDAPLPGLRNSAFNRGRFCEQQVIDLLSLQGWVLGQQRQKLAGVEVDLIFHKAGDWLIVEVKSLSRPEWSEWRLSWRQRQRLRRAAQVLIEQGRRVEIWLALVGFGPNSVQFIPEI